MSGKLHNDLADAVVGTSSLQNEDIPVARRKPGSTHDPGFIIIPVRVKERSRGASAIARSLLPCLLELRALRKRGQPLILTNELAEECGVSRRLKRKALGELAARNIVVLQPHGRRSNPRFEFSPGVLN